MSKIEKTTEAIDFEHCRNLMELIEHACRDSAALGSEFVGRSWCLDNENHVKVAGIYEETVKTLRAAFRGLSVAEEILEQEAASVGPVPRPSRWRRLLLLG